MSCHTRVSQNQTTEQYTAFLLSTTLILRTPRNTHLVFRVSSIVCIFICCMQRLRRIWIRIPYFDKTYQWDISVMETNNSIKNYNFDRWQYLLDLSISSKEQASKVHCVIDRKVIKINVQEEWFVTKLFHNSSGVSLSFARVPLPRECDIYCYTEEPYVTRHTLRYSYFFMFGSSALECWLQVG